MSSAVRAAKDVFGGVGHFGGVGRGKREFMSLPKQKPKTEIRYAPPGPVAASFLQDKTSSVKGIMGPLGSGKSVTCCIDLWLMACAQEPNEKLVRKTRFVIVRNTYPELKSTTIKTWLDWFPENLFGKVRWDVPITQFIRFPLEDGTTVDCEVVFLAMDRPDHVKKLLSLEATAIWLNEARELPKAVLDAATGRVGRYPSKRDKPHKIHDMNWPTRFGVIMDTNPPDDDHWWYKLAEEETPESYKFYRQPSGLSVIAENVKNLPDNYYSRITDGKTTDWVQVYVEAQYGTVADGKPVFNEYNDRVHCAPDVLRPIKQLPLYLGWDFGLTPACVIAQITTRGQLRILDELCSDNMSIVNFARHVVKPHLENEYKGMQIISIGDPAGKARGGDSDEKTSFDLLKGEGFDCDAAHTNSFIRRREAVVFFLSRLTDGEPAFTLSPVCRTLRKGMRGSYKYRRLLVAGTDRYKDEPEKDSYSHPQDALQYICLKLWSPGSKPKPLSRRQVTGPADQMAGY